MTTKEPLVRPTIAPKTTPKTPYNPNPSVKPNPKALLMHSSILSNLKQNKTPFTNIPFIEKYGDDTAVFTFGNERFNQVVEKAKLLNPSNYDYISAHYQIVADEKPYRKQLEELAIRLVCEEFKIEQDTFIFDAKIVDISETNNDNFIKNDEMNESNIKPILFDEYDVPQSEEHKFKVNMEKAKRRLSNALVQGASKKGHYMYFLVADQIKEITKNDNIIQNYGIMMSSNDLVYWLMSDDTIDDAINNSIAGHNELDFESDENKVTIKARGINFPVLVHELIKGIMETFSCHGIPSDPEIASEVIQSEDTLPKEVWDLRLGSIFWDKIRDKVPYDLFDSESFNYFLMELFKVDAYDFVHGICDVLADNRKGDAFINSILNKVNDEY